MKFLAVLSRFSRADEEFGFKTLEASGSEKIFSEDSSLLFKFEANSKLLVEDLRIEKPVSASYPALFSFEELSMASRLCLADSLQVPPKVSS